MADGKFSPATKAHLSRAAAGYCSAPGCDALTIASSSDTSSKESNIGEAAHIKGRRPGTARFDPSQTDDERASEQNGIWLCRSHAALIDRNESIFTVDILQAWKRTHLKKMQKLQLTREVQRSLIPQSVTLNAPATEEKLIELIEFFLISCGIEEEAREVITGRPWAQMFSPTVMILSELAWNSIRHGEATILKLVCGGYFIELETDQKRPFSLNELATQRSGGGGQQALKMWLEEHDGPYPITSGRRRGASWWRIRDLSKGPHGIRPCEVSGDSISTANRWGLVRCPSITIFLGREVRNFSQSKNFVSTLQDLRDRDIRIVSRNTHDLRLIRDSLISFRWEESHSIIFQSECLRITPRVATEG